MPRFDFTTPVDPVSPPSRIHSVVVHHSGIPALGTRRCLLATLLLLCIHGGGDGYCPRVQNAYSSLVISIIYIYTMCLSICQPLIFNDSCYDTFSMSSIHGRTCISSKEVFISTFFVSKNNRRCLCLIEPSLNSF